MNAAIFFEPDGYVLDGPRLMGRQSAGNGFLRAAVAGHGGEPIYGYTSRSASAEAFSKLALSIDPSAQPRWIPGHRLDLLSERGALYRPDQILGPAARLRLRAGPSSYSLCGVTHTLATGSTLEAIADLLAAPVMPWDALICTSTVAVEVVEMVLETQDDYLAWRFGTPVRAQRPQLPLIPLGVHCGDFAFSPEARGEARAALGLDEDEVVALFAGRMSINGKAHPFPMYAALETVAQATGQRLVVLHAGQFANATLERNFHSAAAQFCPSVRAMFVDGKDFGRYREAWRAADIFVSLADSIQETFGLTPIEAMAAGLPVLVTDWNGYKDTVRDGVDGFRVPTWAPPAGSGALIGLKYEADPSSYDTYLSQASTAVALDMATLVPRLTDLVVDGDLRRRLGASGRERARQTFDWSVVYRQYQALWAELDGIRSQARENPAAWLTSAPTLQAGALGPFKTFQSYPTALVGPDTVVMGVAGADLARFEAITAQQLLSFWNPPPALVERLLAAVAAGPATIGQLSQHLGLAPDIIAETVTRLTKLDLLAYRAAAEPRA